MVVAKMKPHGREPPIPHCGPACLPACLPACRRCRCRCRDLEDDGIPVATSQRTDAVQGDVVSEPVLCAASACLSPEPWALVLQFLLYRAFLPLRLFRVTSKGTLVKELPPFILHRRHGAPLSSLGLGQRPVDSHGAAGASQLGLDVILPALRCRGCSLSTKRARAPALQHFCSAAGGPLGPSLAPVALVSPCSAAMALLALLSSFCWSSAVPASNQT